MMSVDSEDLSNEKVRKKGEKEKERKKGKQKERTDSEGTLKKTVAI